MSAPQNVIALIFDFDDTLTDDSTTQLLEAHGIDTREFRGRRVAERVQDGWDNALAYLNLILEEASAGRPLESLTNKKLEELGASLPSIKVCLNCSPISRPSAVTIRSRVRQLSSTS